jgi:hypothetical protein
MLLGCISPSISETQEFVEAVCKSQKFLQENGYLNRLIDPDTSKIKLEIWDNINYNNSGTFDWELLLSERDGAFSDSLYGVSKEGKDFVVYYVIDGGFSCVDVYASGDVHLHEAPCRPYKVQKKVKERDLRCVPD